MIARLKLLEITKSWFYSVSTQLLFFFVKVWSLSAYIYHEMIIVTGYFSKKSFYSYSFYFVEIILNDFILVFLELLNIPNTGVL